MAKKSYRIKAFVWDRRNREYIPETIKAIKSFDDALIAYDNLKVTKDMPSIELIEQTLGKHDFVISSETIKWKDSSGELDAESF